MQDRLWRDVANVTGAAMLAALLALPAVSGAQKRSEEPPRPAQPATPAPDSGAGRSAAQVVDDATLTALVKAALVRDAAIKARNINVDTRRGVVQLKGRVASAAEAEKAVTLARQVDGVVRVENELSIGRG